MSSLELTVWVIRKELGKLTMGNKEGNYPCATAIYVRIYNAQIGRIVRTDCKCHHNNNAVRTGLSDTCRCYVMISSCIDIGITVLHLDLGLYSVGNSAILFI